MQIVFKNNLNSGQIQVQENESASKFENYGLFFRIAILTVLQTGTIMLVQCILVNQTHYTE